ncbi:MAG: methyltransferase domain-containing protein [Rhodothermaceae bacterium]|nr:methyltransferase domain-containing protein [Rhodothermaceae bacterium]
MGFGATVSRQLGDPSGRFGRLLVRLLNWVNAPVNEAALDALDLTPDDVLLDLGFGGGALLREALIDHPTLQALGLDRSPDAVAVARRRLRRFVDTGRLALLEGDAAAMPFAEGACSSLATVNTLYFWPEPAQVLAECHRVLTPGGRLALAYTDAERLDRMEGFRRYNPEAVGVLLEAAGFTHVTTTRFDQAGGFLVTRAQREEA